MKKKILLAALGFLLTSSSALAGVSFPPSSGGNSMYGTSVTFGGDSTAFIGTYNVPPGSANSPTYYTGTGTDSYLGWMVSLSRGRVGWDLTKGYPGTTGGLLRVEPLTVGGCTPNATITFQPGTGGGVQAGTFQVTFDAAGHAPVGTLITLANPGSGYTTAPSYTVASGGSCTTQPLFGYVLGGAIGWGVDGDTTVGWLARIPVDVCTNPPDILVNMIGTNDITAGTAESTITSNIATIVAAEQACGIKPVLTGITPRTIGTGGWTLAMDQERMRINKFEQALAQKSRIQQNGSPTLVYVDTDHLLVDPTQSGATAGNVLTGYTIDGLHPSISGAEVVAIALLNAIQSWLPASYLLPNSQNDIYNATNNPGGNLLGTSGLAIGTSGITDTNTGGTCAAGVIPTGWYNKYFGTGTVTCSVTAETTRTDGLPGQRAVYTYGNTGGTTSEAFYIKMNTNFFSNVTPGTDKLYMTADIDLGNLSQMEYVGCELLETSTINQAGISTWSFNAGSSYPMITNATLAKLAEAKNTLADFGLSSTGSYKMSCISPPITTQSAATAYTPYIYFYGYSNTGTMSFTAKISNVAVRKVTP